METVDAVKNRLWEIYMKGASDIVDGLIQGINGQIARKGNATMPFQEIINLLETGKAALIDTVKKTMKGSDANE